MKLWNYFDKNGLLCQIGPEFDGGDTPSHSGLCWTASKLDPSVNFPSPISLNQEMYLLTTSDNLLIRNPINYNDPSDTSRDQYQSIISALGINEEYLWVAKLFLGLPQNKLNWPEYPNGDLFTPADLTMFERASNIVPKKLSLKIASKIVHLLGDFLTLLSTLWLCFWSTREPNMLFKWLYSKFPSLWFLVAMDPPNTEGVQGSLRGLTYTSDDLDTIQLLVLGALRNTTWINLITRKLYAKFRPGGIQMALNNYFSSDDSPPVNELWVNLIKEYFK